MNELILKALLHEMEANPDRILDMIGKVLDLLKAHPELIQALVHLLERKAAA
jgi:hypothetical protein